MKRTYIYFCIALFTSFIQTTDSEQVSISDNYSSMTQEQLNQAFAAAVYQNDLKKVQNLIQAGANVNTKIKYVQHSYDDYDTDVESAPLLYAVKKCHIDMVKELLKVKKNINNVQTCLNDALRQAIDVRYSGLVQILIEGGAKINCVDGYGRTPLFWAIDQGYAVYKFDDKHMDLKRKALGLEACIDVILKAQAYVDHVDKNGNTPLMEAIKHSDLDTVCKLLKKSTAKINHVNKEGDTALLIALQHVQTTYISGDSSGYTRCINSQQIVQELLDILQKTPGTDFNHKNNKGQTALKLIEKLQR